MSLYYAPIRKTPSKIRYGHKVIYSVANMYVKIKFKLPTYLKIKAIIVVNFLLLEFRNALLTRFNFKF